MDQTIVLGVLVVAVLLGFLFYPALMIRMVGSLVRGIFNLLVDAVGLLLAWI